MQKRKGSLFFLFCSFLWGEPSFLVLRDSLAYVRKEKKYYRDNVYIQSYRGYIGIWRHLPGGVSLQKEVLKYGGDYSTFLKVNRFSPYTKKLSFPQWVFIPYGDRYVKHLEKMGIFRREMEVSQGDFIWPLYGVTLTGELGKRWNRIHAGIDIATPVGTLVVASQSGVVSFAGPRGGYGFLVIMKHGNGLETRYAHLSHIFVREGDVIKKGEAIALSGNTGKSTGPHLHFEIRLHGVPLNPEGFLPPREEAIQQALEQELITYAERTF